MTDRQTQTKTQTYWYGALWTQLLQKRKFTGLCIVVLNLRGPLLKRILLRT